MVNSKPPMGAAKAVATPVTVFSLSTVSSLNAPIDRQATGAVQTAML